MSPGTCLPINAASVGTATDAQTPFCEVVLVLGPVGQHPILGISGRVSRPTLAGTVHHHGGFFVSGEKVITQEATGAEVDGAATID